jgi:hypothetical protein
MCLMHTLPMNRNVGLQPFDPLFATFVTTFIVTFFAPPPPPPNKISTNRLTEVVCGAVCGGGMDAA